MVEHSSDKYALVEGEDRYFIYKKESGLVLELTPLEGAYLENIYERYDECKDDPEWFLEMVFNAIFDRYTKQREKAYKQMCQEDCKEEADLNLFQRLQNVITLFLEERFPWFNNE